MSNAMRSGKRVLAGAAAGALTAGLIPFAMVAGASSANAATYAVAFGFPSMTIIQTADDSITIPVVTYQDGLKANVSGTTTVLTIVDKDGDSVLLDDSPAAGTSTGSGFSIDDPTPAFSSGVGAFNLFSGTAYAKNSSSLTGAVIYSGIAAGTYTLQATMINDSTGVAMASTTLPYGLVSAASASTVAGTASFLEEAAIDSDPATSPQAVATGTQVAASDPYYAQFLNSAGGPIIAPTAMVTGVATPTSGSSDTTDLSSTTDKTTPGIYTLTTSGTETWSATAADGSVKARFASPVNQIVGTLAVEIAASASMTDLDLDSAISASAASITLHTAADDSLVIPATSGVSFTVSGVMEVSSVATEGVNVTFSATPTDDTNFANGQTAYSAISPATAQVVSSDSAGAVSQTYTVTNPVADMGVRITATYPGGSKTFFVKFATPVTTAITSLSAVTANTTGSVSVVATVTDNFDQPIANAPVKVTATGVAPNSTGTFLNTNSSGEVTYTYDVPAGTVSGATSVITFGAWDGSNYSSVTDTTTVTYKTGGAEVSALTVTGSFSSSSPSYATLTGGALNDSDNPLFINTAMSTSSLDDSYNTWAIKVVAKNSDGSAVAGAPVTVVPSTGGWVKSATGAAADSRTFYTDSSGEVTGVVLTATATGTISYAVSSGGVTSTVTAVYNNRPTDARYVTTTSTASSINAGSGATIHVDVTDRFGNGVAGVPITAEENGPGYLPSSSGTTNSSGRVELTYVSVAGQTGTAVITGKSSTSAVSVSMPQAAPSSSDQTYSDESVSTQVGDKVDKATATNFSSTPVQWTVTRTGLSAGVATSPVDIQVVAGGAAKSIEIYGTRTTVKGKPGVVVDGLTTGFEEGAAMVPYIKFPGQTSYAEGSARPKVDADSEFFWQRKTGKKIYIYFSNEDGDVRSDRIIIQAK